MSTMKGKLQTGIAIVLCGAVVGYAVLRVARPAPETFELMLEPMLVELRGVQGAAVLDPVLDCWVVRNPADPPLVLPVRDGDIVWTGLDDFEVVLHYSRDMGSALDLWVDGPLLRVEGRAHCLNLEEDGGWEVLSLAPESMLAQLRVLALDDEATAEQLPLLQKLAEANQQVTVFSESMRLPLADFLFLSNRYQEREEMEGEDPDDFSRVLEAWFHARPDLETFSWGDGLDSPAQLQALSRLSQLRALTLEDWDPTRTGPMPEGFDKLVSLTLTDASLDTLGPLAALSGLQELILIECDALASLTGLSAFPDLLRLQVFEDKALLTDLSPLRDMQQLRIVELAGCTNVTDIAPLYQLPNLREVVLPSPSTQQQFEELVKAQPGLRSVDVSRCEEITDLTSLRTLSQLQILVANLSVHEDSLTSLDALPYLQLMVEDGEDTEEWTSQLAQVRESLPNTHIMTAVHPCLGSGHILWLVSLVALWGWKKA